MGLVLVKPPLKEKRLFFYLFGIYTKDLTLPLNATTFERFVAWARQQQYRGKAVENKTINKAFTVLKMICKTASIEYGWGRAYDPFYGFKKLAENDAYEAVSPFSVEEQKRLVDSMPDHWQPYFQFAFSSRLRAGEQIALKLEDIDLENQVIHIRSAMTRDEDGKKVEGNTKEPLQQADDQADTGDA